MTRLLPQRCTHCSDMYIYQASGEGCHEQSVSDKHCNVCHGAIKKALSDIILERSGEKEFLNIKFRVTTWGKKEDYSVEVPMEYDLINKEFTGNRW